MKYTASLLLLLFIPLLLSGQSDISVKRERTYTGSGLYGFMNGGSDLYLEYGFQKLTTRDIEYDGEEYTVDIYEMATPLDAFGIYSLHTFKCQKADTLNYINCLSAYQYQAVVGKNYISIVFPSGSVKAIKNIDIVFRNYADISQIEKLKVPQIIDNGQPYSTSLKFLRGSLAVSNAQPSLSQWLNDISYSGIWLVIDKTAGDRALIYPSENKDMSALKARIPKDNILEINDTYIYVQCPKKEDKEDYGAFGF